MKVFYLEQEFGTLLFKELSTCSRKLEAIVNDRPRQQFDIPKTDNVFIGGRGLGYTPILKPDDVTRKLNDTILPPATFMYVDKVMDRRKLPFN